MAASLCLAIVLLGQGNNDPDQFPFALHRSMELDDIDREIQRIHDTVLLRRGQYNSTLRLSGRGLASRSDLERDSAGLRYEEAHEAETIAFRAFKAHERDVLGRSVPDDEVKSYTLLLDWLKKQEAMAQVDLDYRDFTLRQIRSLQTRRLVNRQDVEEAEINDNIAQANVALSRSRQAQVTMELTVRQGKKGYNPTEYERLKAEYVKSRLLYYEIVAAGAHNRLTIAQERVKRGLFPVSEIAVFEKAAADAEAALTAERKKLEKAAEAQPTKTSWRTRHRPTWTRATGRCTECVTE